MDIILFFEYVGMASAALSGFLFAIKKGCDWLGIFIAAFLTALGGGIMRDMLVCRPVYSFTHYMPILIVIFMLFLSYNLHLHSRRDGLEKKFIFIFADAIDMVIFSIIGAMVACKYDYNVLGVAMMAFCNGVGGGILRDILLNEVPWFFRTGLYGTISMSVGVIYYVMDFFVAVNIFSIMLLFCVGIAFRLLAYYKAWHLPNLD
ncbi:MAG: trimeric intracellular cation channel family protein [Campylobacter sp.]